MRRSSSSPLPVCWSRRAKSALLCAVALARTALVQARGGLAESPLAQRRRAAEIDGLRAENALLREELRIKDARTTRVPAHQRPHHVPVERLAILSLRAAAGWSAAETARRFLLAPATIAAWTRRIDEGGTDALVQTREPVNRFPELIAQIVASVRATLPTMGKVRIAQVLARAGLEIAPSTVARLLAKPRRAPPTRGRSGAVSNQVGAKSGRIVAARYPHHLWHADLTVVPTAAGFWVPWLPFSLPVVWPFAWTVAVVLDHHSRAVVACAVFRKQPTAAALCALLDRAILDAGRTPRHLVTDRGVQFQGEYLAWCKRRRVKPRFGAVGKKGSIAVIGASSALSRTSASEGFPCPSNVRRFVASSTPTSAGTTPSVHTRRSARAWFQWIASSAAASARPSKLVRDTRFGVEESDDGGGGCAEHFASSSSATAAGRTCPSSHCAK